MDLAIHSLIQFSTVINNLAILRLPLQIISYVGAILISVCLILSVYFITIFIYFNRASIYKEKFQKIWGALFTDLDIKNKIISCMYNILFLLRRLVMSLTFIIFSKFPIVQLVMISISCWIVRYI
jgi:hypothetical protein